MWQLAGGGLFVKLTNTTPATRDEGYSRQLATHSETQYTLPRRLRRHPLPKGEGFEVASQHDPRHTTDESSRRQI
jgi:hypothetical protein